MLHQQVGGLGSIVFLIVWIAIAFWPARVAARKGHSFVLFFLFSLGFLPPLLSSWPTWSEIGESWRKRPRDSRAPPDIPEPGPAQVSVVAMVLREHVRPGQQRTPHSIASRSCAIR